jgi:hypothetical protein
MLHDGGKFTLEDPSIHPRVRKGGGSVVENVGDEVQSG